MENCEYTTVFKDTEITGNGKNNWKPLMRQCLISSGVCCLYFLQGLFLGAPTVFVAQMRRDVNSTEIITDEMLSWLTATPVISSVPFVIILPWLFNRVGRKCAFLLVWILDIIGFVIFYNSTKVYQILISEVFAGPTFASTVTIAPVIVAEYTSPKYRGALLSLKGATACWGIWVSNAIGTFFPWKNIAIVAFVCSIYIISVVAWPESPYWLAKRGRYEESAKSHRWLKGVNEYSEKELAQLIISRKKYDEANSVLATDIGEFCNVHGLLRTWSIITSRPFYKPVIISIVLFAQFYLAGKLVISMYAIDVLQHLSSDKSFVYKEMLILDGVTVFSMYVGCILARYFKRRTLLLMFSGLGISILYILSVYMYLASLSVIVENDILILVLLTVFSVATSCGPLLLSTTIYGEIISPRHQNIAMVCVGFGGVTTISVLLKVSPFMFKYFKMHGSFLFYAISSNILLIVLFIWLPETKNKTIQEIEHYFTEDNVSVMEDKTNARKGVELHNLML